MRFKISFFLGEPEQEQQIAFYFLQKWCSACFREDGLSSALLSSESIPIFLREKSLGKERKDRREEKPCSSSCSLPSALRCIGSFALSFGDPDLSDTVSPFLAPFPSNFWPEVRFFALVLQWLPCNVHFLPAALLNYSIEKLCFMKRFANKDRGKGLRGRGRGRGKGRERKAKRKGNLSAA